jgi:hypothetical protein
VGLFLEETLDSVKSTLSMALETSGGRVEVEEANRLVSSLGAGNADIEALAQLWPEWRVERPSLFEAYLVAADKDA